MYLDEWRPSGARSHCRFYPALPGLGYVWPTGPPALKFWCFPDWIVISHLKTKSLRKIGGSQTLSRQRLRLLHLPTLQTAGAHLHASMRSLNDRPDRTQIHVPAPLGDVMSVADVISKLRPLAAYLANLCHDCSGWDQNLIGKT